ncbi:hypothetical protein V866_002498 [Kwoniella sp. B9012]
MTIVSPSHGYLAFRGEPTADLFRQAPTLPTDFLFGFATAAAQIEGGGPDAEKASGRGDSIWDEFCDRPGNIRDGSNVKRTCNHLEKYKEDIALMKSLGANSYRFSISWPRVIPLGGKGDPVNQKGIRFYNDLIDECLKVGLVPFVTLYHWDLPLELFKRYGGWLDKEKIVEDYTHYAKTCFDLFGDRVKHWLTFNEPWCTAVLGHGIGQFAPGHVSNTEPWIVGQSLMIAHASAAKLYMREYKAKQGGMIGITLNGDWTDPYDESPENVEAAQRKMDFAVGWFADVIYLGRYPQSMIDILGDRLPQFSQEELDLLKDSSEFYGCNTYTTNTIKATRTKDEYAGYTTMAFDKPDGTEIGVKSQLGWLRDVPWGFRRLLNYLYQRYKKPIYMTENGWAIKGESALSPAEASIQADDEGRVQYYNGYTQALKEAIQIDGVDVRSYFGFMDNFEWASGLVPRFGSVYVDYETFERTPKDSATSLMKFFKDNISTK